MAGLDFPRLNQSTPESIIDDYLQRGIRRIQDKYRLQWDEVNKRRNILGGRKQMEMLSTIDMKGKQELQAFIQSVQQQQDQLAQVDQLAQQGGFDPYEAKMRMVLGPEVEAAMFPTREKPRTFEQKYADIQYHKDRLRRRQGEFFTDPGGQRIKDWKKFWFSEKKTRTYMNLRVEKDYIGLLTLKICRIYFKFSVNLKYRNSLKRNYSDNPI